MSTISLHTRDSSDELCRRFAVIAAEYLDRPEQARSYAAQVPLENLFRLLQMYRYDAFADEQRSGVLAQQGETDLYARPDDEEWHSKIESAVKQSLTMSFGEIPKEQAIAELQITLRWLASVGSEPSPDIRTRSKAFFSGLGAALS
jgi:hypothetical protein